MTRRRAIYLVARREVRERGRSRAFLLSLVVTVALLLAGVFLPALIGGDRADRLGIVGAAPAGFSQAVSASATQAGTAVHVEAIGDVAAGESRLRDGSLNGLLVIPASGTPTYEVKERQNELLGQIVASSWSQLRVRDLLAQAGIGADQLAAAATPPTVRELEPSDPNRQTSFLFANVGVVLLFISIFTFGTWVLTGVVEEKQSRVVEVVLSTIEPRDLLIGKVVGIGLLGLVQLLVMVSVGLGAGLAAGRISLPPTTGVAVVQLILWFILGYGLYSTALGVLGALASRMEEASNASSPVSFIATGSYLFALLVVLNDPSGVAARVATFIPPVAPMVVPLRTALGAIEPWEIVLSVAVMLLTIWGLFVVGGRVYAGAVLRTTGRVRLRDAIRAARR
ncbi:MAG TPA: ABC transporter permease [Candidatus Limnocylindrales bacterium]